MDDDLDDEDHAELMRIEDDIDRYLDIEMEMDHEAAIQRCIAPCSRDPDHNLPDFMRPSSIIPATQNRVEYQGKK